ncbi:GAF domain-containing sensor histidine kinase [Nocardioides sp. YIM 152315]|uniref:GAF domain-containing sensor histidine kinase n=1 Tax=Nocardioides sp. YIM 152315 TaxID=3031760 RepID=UPI0023DB6D9A|nr:GAF domain-containing sensor histidine kinase [Nocardioides sp. YIM 152315]MDF1605064.1 GAF domain-containing sensor histidine kinase [Nocardioides sp. YIM 152315]
MTDAPGAERPVRGSRWSDDSSREALQSIIEAIREVAGFDVVGVSAVRDDGYLQLLCVVGPEDARETLADTLAPLAPLLEALEDAEDWGRLKYVRHDRHALDIERWGWTSDGPRDVPDGVWHPEDVLVAPLHGDDGRLIAVLGLDVPRDGLVPDESKRPLLDVYARQASGAVVATLERERMAEQVRLAAAAADIVRRAAASMSAERTLAECATAIVDGFRAQALWTQLVGEQPRAVHDDAPVAPPPETVAVFERYARALWETQDVAVFAPDRPAPPSRDVADHAAMTAFLGQTHAESLLLAPLGSGPDCLGWIGMSRGHGGAEWSEAEAAMALDIGRDLGRALASARMFEREHQLVQELQEVADYKSHLVATVSHELRTPLTSIVGYLELLAGDPGLSERSRTAIAAIERGSTRLSRVVEELLVLHHTADATGLDHAQPVDLSPLVADIIELNSGPAESRGITVAASLQPSVAPVTGVAHELEHVVANLVGNAVKYTRDRGRVDVRLENADGEVVLTCSDDGIGISDADQQHVFEEFYRSTDPAASQQSGTGLGLAIVRRVVERHGGRIELESALGAGSTFRVRLPASA